jgi:hypothetical protein
MFCGRRTVSVPLSFRSFPGSYLRQFIFEHIPEYRPVCTGEGESRESRESVVGVYLVPEGGHPLDGVGSGDLLQ